MHDSVIFWAARRWLSSVWSFARRSMTNRSGSQVTAMPACSRMWAKSNGNERSAVTRVIPRRLRHSARDWAVAVVRSPESPP